MAGIHSLFGDIMETSIKGQNSFVYLWNFLLLVEQHGDIYERIGVISDKDLPLKLVTCRGRSEQSGWASHFIRKL